MNQVHEQCPKIRLRKNTESNRAKNRLSAPSALPAGPAARPGCSPSARASRLARYCPARCCPARPCHAQRRVPPPALPCAPQRQRPRLPACRPSTRAPAPVPCRAPNLASAQMGSSSFQVSAPIFFFPCFQLLENSQKKLFIHFFFHFP